MTGNSSAFDALAEALQAKVSESWERYSRGQTPENLAAFERAVKVFADWMLRGKLSEDS